MLNRDPSRYMTAPGRRCSIIPMRHGEFPGTPKMQIVRNCALRDRRSSRATSPKVSFQIHNAIERGRSRKLSAQTLMSCIRHSAASIVADATEHLNISALRAHTFLSDPGSRDASVMREAVRKRWRGRGRSDEHDLIIVKPLAALDGSSQSPWKIVPLERNFVHADSSSYARQDRLVDRPHLGYAVRRSHSRNGIA